MLAPAEAPPRLGKSVTYSKADSIGFANLRAMDMSKQTKRLEDLHKQVLDEVSTTRPPRHKMYIRTDYTMEIYPDPSSIAYNLIGWMDIIWVPFRNYRKIIGRFYKLKDPNKSGLYKNIRIMSRYGKYLVMQDVNTPGKIDRISRYKLNSNYEEFTI